MRTLILWLLSLLCASAQLGPVQQPIFSNATSSGTGVAGLWYWWVSSDVPTGQTITNQWTDRIQGERAFGFNGPTNATAGVFFDGGDDYTTNSRIAWNQTNVSVFVIFTPITPTSINGSMLGSDLATAFGFMTRSAGGNLWQWSGAGNDDVGDYVSGTQMTAGIVSTNGASTMVFYNNGIPTVTNALANVNYLGFFGRSVAATTWYRGYIREVQIYTNYLTGANMTTLQSYYTTTYP